MAAKRIPQEVSVDAGPTTDDLVVPFRVVRPSVGTAAIWDSERFTATITYWTDDEYAKLAMNERPKNAQRFLDGMIAFQFEPVLDLRPVR